MCYIYGLYTDELYYFRNYLFNVLRLTIGTSLCFFSFTIDYLFSQCWLHYISKVSSPS